MSASGAIWYFWPQASFWPLLLAMLAWVARGTALRFALKPAVLALSLAVFLLTAGVGVWAAPQPEVAWGKFWVLVGAVLLFYALADQPKENLWLAAGLIGLFGLFLSVCFILVNDWQSLPADLEILSRIIRVWTSLRPELPVSAVNPNTVGGILAMVFPFPLALGLHGWKTRKRSLALTSATTCGIIAAGLVLTSSRGAWLALIVSLGLWFLWELSRIIASRAGQSQKTIFLIVLILTGILLAWVAISYPGGLAGLSGRLPGMQGGSSRVELAGSTLQLIEDFPFTGGGLGSFPGLYSQYIRVTPFFLFAYSHNLYLDVALEQGVLGFAALMAVLLASTWITTSRLWVVREADEYHLLSWAVWMGLVTICLHGLVDDALYGVRGTPLVFLLSGMAVALTKLNQENIPEAVLQTASGAARATRVRTQVWTAVTFAVFGIVLATMPGWRRSLAAGWYANMGAVEMARLELASWPTGKWVESKDVSHFAKARALFARSLALDPENRTANHRLGLIALQAQDFPAANSFLERAYTEDLEHRGVRKVLGYSYAWSGQIFRALSLLEDIPEARYEMNNYVWWWKSQGRPDLSEQARTMTTLFHDGSTLEQEH